MNLSFRKLGNWVLPCVVAAMPLLVSCEEESLDGGIEDASSYITLSNVEATFNNVSFDLKADGAISISYACALASADALDAERVMEAGISQGVSEGSYTISSLTPETDYILYAVAQIPSVGIVGPISTTFTTLVNDGAPSSTTSAGIRAVDLGTSSATNLSWEVTNGDDVDFSLSMVMPTVVMENLLFEMAKDGVSKEEYIQSFVTTYGYLQVATEGKGSSAVFNYSDVYTTTPIFPDANYTIYSLAFSGDYATYADGGTEGITMLEYTEVPVTTTAIPRTGDPAVTLETTECGYIHFTHKVTPNADAKYWAAFFTTTAEISEFRDYYDKLEGTGKGDERLKEYLVHQDADAITDLSGEEAQSDECEWSVSVGWDQAGIDFSRLAIGLDNNLVLGDDYVENINQVIVQDNSTPADFTVTYSHIGAGSFFLKCRLGENCRQVYWRMEAAGYFDAALADPELNEDLGRTLWDEGWAFHRNDYPEAAYNEALGKYPELTYEEFHYGEATNTTFDIVAVGLNTSGGISEVIKVGTFTTSDFVYTGAFEPSIEITIPQSEVSKTSATAYYNLSSECAAAVVGSDDYYNLHREYYHVNLISTDEVVATYTKEQQAEYLYNYGNCWPIAYSNGVSMNWAALESDASFTYLYASVNEKGEMGEIKSIQYSTANNDGGPNPTFAITVNEEDVMANTTDATLYGTSYLISPSADVRGYSHLFFDESVLESYGVPTNSVADLQAFFLARIGTEGLPTTDVAYNSSYNTPKGKRLWVVADGYGDEDTNRMLSYVEVLMDSNGNVSVADQVDYKYETESVSIMSATRAYTQSAQKVTRSWATKEVVRDEINYVVYPYEPKTPATIREETGLPVYSFKEMSLRILLKGGEPKL